MAVMSECSVFVTLGRVLIMVLVDVMVVRFPPRAQESDTADVAVTIWDDMETRS